jgi:uncharacterized GH25 family protein
MGSETRTEISPLNRRARWWTERQRRPDGTSEFPLAEPARYDRGMKKRLWIVVIIATVAAAAEAHDFWLAANPWHARPGATVSVTANVGDRFPKPTSLTAPDRIASVALVGPEGKTTLAPSFSPQEQSLAFDVRLPERPATYIVVLTIEPRFIEIKSADFTSYLTHEGLDRVVEERRRLGETETPGREQYSRYSKVLIAAGEGASEHVTKPVGLPAELVPLRDPTLMRRGDSLALQLLADEKPVTGALVGAIYASSTGAPDDWPLKARTDSQGRVEFKLDQPGPWLIRSVHMVRRRGSGHGKYDWESFWASLSFDLAPGTRAPSSEQ